MIIEFKYDTVSKKVEMKQDGEPAMFDNFECYKDYDDPEKFHVAISRREEDKENGMVRHMSTYASQFDTFQRAVHKKMGL